MSFLYGSLLAAMLCYSIPVSRSCQSTRVDVACPGQMSLLPAPTARETLMDVSLTQYPSVSKMWSMMGAPKAASIADVSYPQMWLPFLVRMSMRAPYRSSAETIVLELSWPLCGSLGLLAGPVGLRRLSSSLA